MNIGTKRTLRFQEYGNPEDVLKQHTAIIETLRPEHHLVHVTSRPIHPGDLAGVRGRYPGAGLKPTEARTPGLEGVGIVLQPASGSETVAGDRIAFLGVPGAYAEIVAVPAKLAIGVRDDVPDAVAGHVLINGVTARLLVREAQRSAPGGVILQNAAKSSVARLVARFATDEGWNVINLVRSSAAAEVLRAEQRGNVVSTDDSGWVDQVKSIAGPHGIPVIIDPVGGHQAAVLLELLASRGTMIASGGLASGPAPLDWLTITSKAVTVRGVSIGDWMDSASDEQRLSDMAICMRLAQSDPNLFPVSAEFDFADFKKAIRHVETSGRQSGVVNLTSPLRG